MKVSLTILSSLLFLLGFAQTKSSKSNSFPIEVIDTTLIADSIAELNLVVERRHSNPLYIANGIIVRVDSLQLDSHKVYGIDVYKGPKAYNKFGLIAYNGAIVIKSHQDIVATTPYEIRLAKFPNIDGEVLYAINGDIIRDSLIKIAQNSIIEIEELPQGIDKGYNDKLKNYNCINIWTLTKDERVPFAAGCSGIKIKKE